ncbi:hypothetical protein Nepgr_022434 [Nepenthes gracilis]|uniref:Pre-mRNA polyadenylation factor Fip1 domain-containing protein n=1 Tax=Nepenthes gracilis TaxID=150966 RepID=A0AAD3XWZ6_NEPGR|nr:hypothetical protein Nepgr_022434 [Nepenthes gracilis]
MEDDEFGDLYTDVLVTLSSSSAFQQQAPPTTASPANLQIGINLKSDDDDIVVGPSDSKLTSSDKSNNHSADAEPPNQKSHLEIDVSHQNSKTDRKLEDQIAGEKEELGGVSENLALDSAEEAIGSRVLEREDRDLDVGDEEDGFKSNIGGSNEVGGDREGEFRSKDENFGIEGEDNDEMMDLSSKPSIPGLDTGPPVFGAPDKNKGIGESANSVRRDDGSGEGDDWDSDSEDDLQIVLNDDHHGPMAMNRNGMVGSDDEDEDGDPLVIIADNDGAHQPIEEQEWGEDVGQAADGEKKEMADAGKSNGGVAVASKIGYNSFGYHPFHSQFKYVRPGAAPLPGAQQVGPGGAPSQVRPMMNMASIAVRGRGDWRPTSIKGVPPMQKGFHPGYWGANMSNRGYGGGLEFTLPSHKTIFEVDVDSFEEKPWKYPGIDLSDFFNFNLNEESWKEYCKQLEQLRLESTMQSRIRVYESGRAEQDYDPELPPELAAAVGHDRSAIIANAANADAGQSDLAKGTARVRPPLPTGRAIQVEAGYGERLPSVDTRPPRFRESDTIIEIVLQDSIDDDSSTGNEAPEQPDHDASKEDQVANVILEDSARVGNESFEEYPEAYHATKSDGIMKRSPLVSSIQDGMPEEEKGSPSPPEFPIEYHTGSRVHTPACSADNVGISFEERQNDERAHEGSPLLNCDGEQDGKFLDDQPEVSTQSIIRKRTINSSSPAPSKERSFEYKVTTSDDEPFPADMKPGKGKEDISSDSKNKLYSTKKQKLSSQVEPTAAKGTHDGSNSKAASSGNSKATLSSRDHEKWSDGVDEEVIQDGHSTYSGDLRQRRGEDEQALRRKDRDGGPEAQRSHVSAKGKEDPYAHRKWDPYAANHFHAKTEGLERRKDRDYSDGAWQRRDDDLHGRRVKAEDQRKHDRADEMVSRHRSKLRESEMFGNSEHLHSRKPLENGSWRGYDKDAGLRYWENVDDIHGKRRKDNEPVRDYIDKAEILHAHRETTSRQKREKDEILDQRKREKQPRRDSTSDHHSVRHRDEAWSQREKAERQRDRDEWHRPKQMCEENLSKRERDDGRGGIRIGKNIEEKSWIGHARVKEDYKDYIYKDTGRHNELLRMKDRIEDESNLQHRERGDVFTRGNQLRKDDNRSRQERSSSRNDRAVHASDSQRVHEKKHRDSRKVKESEGSHHSNSGPLKKHQEEKCGTSEMVVVKGSNEPGNAEHENSMQHRLAREQREDASSDDEQQVSKRGRSKLERWTSQKERNSDIKTKSSSLLKVKEADKNNPGFSAKVSEEYTRKIEAVDNNQSGPEGKDVEGQESKDADLKPTEDRHLDTVAKLKKRSERFKLPMPSEKDAVAIKKMESEPLPSSQSEAPASSEVKQERPARKRRWISS